MPQDYETACEFSVGLGALLLLLVELIALGGVWSVCEGVVGSYARVLKSAAGAGIICLLPAACCPTYDFC